MSETFGVFGGAELGRASGSCAACKRIESEFRSGSQLGSDRGSCLCTPPESSDREESGANCHTAGKGGSGVGPSVELRGASARASAPRPRYFKLEPNSEHSTAHRASYCSCILSIRLSPESRMTTAPTMAQMQPPPPGTSSLTALPFSTHADQEEDPQTCLCSYDHRHRVREAHSTCRSSCSSLQPRAVLLHRRHLAPRRPSRSPRAAGHRTRARQALMRLQLLASPGTVVAPGRTRDRRR